MRKIAATLTLVLMAGTAGAADAEWNFSGANCNTPVNCDLLKENIENILAIANQCVVSRLAIGTGEESLFEDSRGLDSNDCLVSKSRAKATQGKTIVPKCCIVKTSDDLCQISCSSIGY